MKNEDVLGGMVDESFMIKILNSLDPGHTPNQLSLRWKQFMECTGWSRLYTGQKRLS